MALKSLCKTDVVTIERDASLAAASRLMQRHHVGCIVVTEQFNGKRIPCGMITDRDVALSMGSSSKPQDIKVEQIMQGQPITAQVGDGIYEVITKMRDNGIRRLPVLSEDGSLFGLISADDLLSLMGEEIDSLVKITQTQVKMEKGIRTPSERHVQMT